MSNLMFLRSRRAALAVSSALLLAGFAAPMWERMPQPSASGPFQSVLVHPSYPNQLIVATRSQVFEGSDNSHWKHLWDSRSLERKIHRLIAFPELPEEIFVLTKDGAFKGNLKTRRWNEIFRGKTSQEKSVLSFAVLPEDPDHWFAGTEGGLFESDDSGKTWFRFSRFSTRDAVPLLRFVGERLFAATRERLYASDNLNTFRPVFSLTSGDAFEFLEIEDASASELEEPAAHDSDFRDLYGAGRKNFPLWLATAKGIFESPDGGTRWTALSRSGLRSIQVKSLVYSEKSRELFAGTSSGVYVYDAASSRWREMFQGLAHPEVFSMTLVSGNQDALIALTPDGLMRYSILPDGIELPQRIEPSPEKINLFRELVRLEPSARKVQEEVVRYGDIGNNKIKRWHAQSRLASLVPRLSLGRDFTKTNNVDIDRGGTNTPDEFILGPEDKNIKWDFGVNWDLGNLIWASNQTSIDSRQKLMVELRNDMLAEATRIYFERRHLQMEIIFMPAASEWDHYEKLMRMEELTSLLDAMTGGQFGREIEEANQRNPELQRLWSLTIIADQTRSGP